jgi:hypothetical protein
MKLTNFNKTILGTIGAGGVRNAFHPIKTHRE